MIETPSSSTESWLIVRCAEIWLALPIHALVEVVRMVAPASVVPHAPRYCLGTVDYHGQLLPLIDLGARLGLCAPRRWTQVPSARLIIAATGSPLAAAGFVHGANDRSEPIPDGANPATAGREARPGLALLVDDVIELCERPRIAISPSLKTGHSGLVCGSVQFREGQTALVLDLTLAAVVPLRARVALRAALAALATGPTASRDIGVAPAAGASSVDGAQRSDGQTRPERTA